MPQVKPQKQAPMPEPARDCAACGKARNIMLTIETVDGPRTYCSPCYRERA